MLNISFTGDVCLNGRFAENLKSGKPLFDASVQHFLSKQPFLCCNFEGAESDENSVIKKGTSLKNESGSISYLTGQGFNIFNLANNHIFDVGLKGLTDSIFKINNHEVYYLGAGRNIQEAVKPVILKTGNVSVALLAISDVVPNLAKKSTFGVFGFNKKTLKKTVAKLKQECNWVIVMYHGGEEYSLFPSPTKRKRLHWICSHTKTDAVIAHHSHTFQGFEKLNGKLVFYSLGNFIFDLINHEVFPFTSEGAILTLSFTHNEIYHKFYPIHCHSKEGVVVVANEAFIDKINHLSDFSNYKYQWQKECYRLVFKRKEHNELNPKQESLQNKSVLMLVGSLKFYKQLFRLLKNWNLANIYFNALIYKIKYRNHGSFDS